MFASMYNPYYSNYQYRIIIQTKQIHPKCNFLMLSLTQKNGFYINSPTCPNSDFLSHWFYSHQKESSTSVEPWKCHFVSAHTVLYMYVHDLLFTWQVKIKQTKHGCYGTEKKWVYFRWLISYNIFCVPLKNVWIHRPLFRYVPWSRPS